MNRTFIFFIINILVSFILNGQPTKIIEIRKAGSSQQDENLYPGANILLKDKNIRVDLFHEGAIIISDRAFFYGKKNFFKAEGNVVFSQGDSLKITCSKLEYDGNSRKAKAWGNVYVKRPDMSLETDTLYLDRKRQIGFYKTYSKIIDSTTILTSNKGTFFMEENKYRFTSNVNINNPKYIVIAEKLDYYSDLDHAYLYGPSHIKGNDYMIYSETGFYDLKNQKGNFQKNAKINYDGKIILGDSLYFEKNKEYASATNRISIKDTLNNSIIYGHYGEVFKAKDSAIITKRAVSLNIIENDSLYIHADTLIAIGPEENRLLKGFYDVRIFKSDIRGKSDSLFLDQKTGNIELIKKPFTKKENQLFTEEEKNKRNPILWFGDSQMTGDEIFLLTDLKTKKLDSLKIIGDAFVIEKDSLSNDGFNQIKGGILNGDFVEGKLNNIEVIKNTQVIYYLYSDENSELIGIDKTICSSLNMIMVNNEISDITFHISPSGEVFPEEEIDPNDRKLKGFIWRLKEKPKNKNDLFSKTDQKILLPKIKDIETPSLFFEEFEYK
ncbi:MAG: OstA-like protein [Flavobacteriaceae bacterium]|nr:OstA-like protein [Flavobacteriaceae bacterium]